MAPSLPIFQVALKIFNYQKRIKTHNISNEHGSNKDDDVTFLS
jgi:hypothetical protein